MKTLFALLAVIGQLAVLVFMAGEREYVLRNGEIVYLRTSPVDPRDVFRGDYVALDYEIAWVSSRLWQGELPEHGVKTATKVYAALATDANGLAHVTALGEAPPAEGPYLRGRVDYQVGGGDGPRLIRVRYGLEQYFVQQGQGLEIEARRGRGTEVQVPMEIAVAVGPRGTSVIRDFRWSRLGIGLEIARQPRPRGNNVTPAPDVPLSPKLKLTIKNVSEAPLSLANPGPDCGFALIRADWEPETVRQVERHCDRVGPGIGDTVRLEPGQAYDFEIDLSLPHWHVIEQGKEKEIGALNQWQRYRLVYRSPDVYAAPSGRPDPALWHGSLPSRAFAAAGTID